MMTQTQCHLQCLAPVTLNISQIVLERTAPGTGLVQALFVIGEMCAGPTLQCLTQPRIRLSCYVSDKVNSGLRISQTKLQNNPDTRFLSLRFSRTLGSTSLEVPAKTQYQ